MGKKSRKRATSNSLAPSASMGGGRIGLQPSFRNWNPGVNSADVDDSWELRDLRGYSRDLYRTSPIGSSGINQSVAYRVGTGLKCQPRILREWLNLTEEQRDEWQEKQKNMFEMWATSTWASVDGDMNFYELQDLIARSHKISGDVFTILVEKDRPGWPFKLALQVIEADRVCNENNGANTNECFEGIQRAADGEIISIWVAPHHPGGLLPGPTKGKWQEIPVISPTGRRNILHRKDKLRPGQSRGLPALSQVVGLVKQFTRFADAEVEAAVNSAGMAVFAEMELQSFQDLFTPEQQNQYIDTGITGRGQQVAWEKGRVMHTLPGEKIVSPTPGRPNPNFGAFAENLLTLVGMGLSLPPEVMTGLFKSSYTAARAASQQMWNMIYTDRASDVAHTCQPVYAAFLDEGVADGWIKAPGYYASPFTRYAWQHAEWTGSGPASLNPYQEAQAAQLRAQFLTSEETETNLYDGGDYAARHAQRAREAAARRRDGLPPLEGGAPASPQQGTQDQQDTADQTEEDDLLDDDTEDLPDQ